MIRPDICLGGRPSRTAAGSPSRASSRRDVHLGVLDAVKSPIHFHGAILRPRKNRQKVRAVAGGQKLDPAGFPGFDPAGSSLDRLPPGTLGQQKGHGAGSLADRAGLPGMQRPTRSRIFLPILPLFDQMWPINVFTESLNRTARRFGGLSCLQRKPGSYLPSGLNETAPPEGVPSGCSVICSAMARWDQGPPKSILVTSSMSFLTSSVRPAS